MRRKVIKIGDSMGITLPKQDMEDIGISVGDKIFVYTDKKNKRFTISQRELQDFELLAEQKQELIHWAKDFIERYRKDLEALAEK